MLNTRINSKSLGTFNFYCKLGACLYNYKMLPRRLGSPLDRLLSHSPAVVLLGPRQVGKTTLALEIGATRPSVYLDLEDEDDRVKLSNPASYFADHEQELVILDEVHRVPELFQRLRGIIDRGRRRGKENGASEQDRRPREYFVNGWTVVGRLEDQSSSTNQGSVWPLTRARASRSRATCGRSVPL